MLDGRRVGGEPTVTVSAEGDSGSRPPLVPSQDILFMNIFKTLK